MSSPDTKEVERTAQEQKVLIGVARTLTSLLELPDLLDEIIKKIIGVLPPAQGGTIMLWDQTAGLFRPEASFGFDQKILKQMGLQAGESITGKVFDKGETVLLSNQEDVRSAMQDMREANRDIMNRALGSATSPICALAVPISVGDQKFGVLVLETLNGPHVFTEDHIPFVQSLADLIALAIDRTRLVTRADSIRSANDAERLRSELMATLSHELRMPLTAIRGYATALLLDEVEWSSEKQTEFLNLIDEECENMHGMLTDLLDSSLIDINQITMAPQPIRIQYVASEVCSEMQHRAEHHHLIVDLPSDFPIVQADPHWVKQIFRNILDNAIKYSPRGGLILVRGELRANNLVVSISDQGIGISPEDLIPLFEKFFRVKSSNGFRIPGTGLGLPIARAIVEAHGGRIWVESALGEGTTVSFSLPNILQVPEKRERSFS